MLLSYRTAVGRPSADRSSENLRIGDCRNCSALHLQSRATSQCLFPVPHHESAGFGGSVLSQSCGAQQFRWLSNIHGNVPCLIECEHLRYVRKGWFTSKSGMQIRKRVVKGQMRLKQGRRYGLVAERRRPRGDKKGLSPRIRTQFITAPDRYTGAMSSK